MPRISDKTALEHALYQLAYSLGLFLLLSDENETTDDDYDDFDFLGDAWQLIHNQRYLVPRFHGSAGRFDVGRDVIDEVLHTFSEAGMRAEFRMSRGGFWRLVDLLTEKGIYTHCHQVYEVLTFCR
jgi:hypothetical protein